MLFNLFELAICIPLSNWIKSKIKNTVCDIVKPRVGSVVKVALIGGTMDHSGIYIGRPIFGIFGKEQIVEVTNIEGFAMVRRVSIKDFFNGVPGGFKYRTGDFIYVACKQDRNGKCIAMGSKDVAKRAKAAVGQASKYYLVFNNCHMFTEYCITGIYPKVTGTILSIEKALKNKYTQESSERLWDMWRSTGIHR